MYFRTEYRPCARSLPHSRRSIAGLRVAVEKVPSIGIEISVIYDECNGSPTVSDLLIAQALLATYSQTLVNTESLTAGLIGGQKRFSVWFKPKRFRAWRPLGPREGSRLPHGIVGVAVDSFR